MKKKLLSLLLVLTVLGTLLAPLTVAAAPAVSFTVTYVAEGETAQTLQEGAEVLLGSTFTFNATTDDEAVTTVSVAVEEKEGGSLAYTNTYGIAEVNSTVTFQLLDTTTAGDYVLKVNDNTSDEAATINFKLVEEVEVPTPTDAPTPTEAPVDGAPYENVKYTITSTEAENEITLNIAVSGINATTGSLALAFDTTKVALAAAEDAEIEDIVTAATGIDVFATRNTGDRLSYAGDGYVLFSWYPEEGPLDATSEAKNIASITFTVAEGAVVNHSTFGLYDLQAGDFAAILHRAEMTDDSTEPLIYCDIEDADQALTVEFAYTGADLYPVTFTGVAGTVITIGEDTYTVGDEGSVVINLPKGNIAYTATAPGYDDVSGTADTTTGDSIDIAQTKRTYNVTPSVDAAKVTLNAPENATYKEAYTFTYQPVADAHAGMAPATFAIQIGDNTYGVDDVATSTDEDGVTTIIVPAELVVDTIEITITYPAIITFTGVANTEIAIDGKIVTLNAEGKGEIALAAGTYTYTATVDGYAAAAGEFTVEEADLGVALDQKEIFNVTVTDNGEVIVDGAATAIEDAEYSFTYEAVKDAHKVDGIEPTITIVMNGATLTAGDYTVEENEITIAAVTGDITITVDYPAIITFEDVVVGTTITISKDGEPVETLTESYVIALAAGNYTYTATVGGYADITDAALNVGAEDDTVTLDQKQLFAVTNNSDANEVAVTFDAQAIEDTEYSFTYELVDDELIGVIPTITITIGGEAYTGYTDVAGTVTIPAAAVTGAIEITIDYEAPEEDIATITVEANYIANDVRAMTVVFTPEEGEAVTVTGYGTATANLAAGDYVVTVSAPGCLTYTARLTVVDTEDDELTVDLYAGDLNADGMISNVDLARVILAYNKTGDFGLADLNADNSITTDDIVAVTTNMGRRANVLAD